MIVLAARPGMGKTAFVLTMARNITVEYNVPVAVFVEMSAVQLVQRLTPRDDQLINSARAIWNRMSTPNCTNASAASRMLPCTSMTRLP